MWKAYSSDYIKNNRSSGVSVMIAAFVSALLLSLLCGWFYNMWKYEVERIELQEGGWQSRMTGAFDRQDIETVRSFANIREALIRDGEGAETDTVMELYFNDYRAVFSDTPRIAGQLGVSPEQIAYNYGLLAMYMIRSPQDTAPRLLFPMFVAILLLASVSLILIIHNSFAVSMNARIHQFGIFSSIGATPKQICACLLQEAAVLCAGPILVGNLLGIAGSMGVIQLSNILLGDDIPGRHEAVFGYRPPVLALTLCVTALTVWISAWLPARKLSRLTPLEAMRSTGELQLKRRKRSRVLALLFGVEGELAGNALKAQRKALRTASLSLIFSFMAFTVMQCFFATIQISTRETYFERYQDAWDIMVTVKGAEPGGFEMAGAIRELNGVESAIAYQKAAAKTIVTEGEMSEEMKALGGFTYAPDHYVTEADGGWLVNAPVIILDDDSFMSYCEQIGAIPRPDGAVVLNQIRDVTNPDFRHPEYMPYINARDSEENAASVLRRQGDTEMAARIPVLAYTDKVPVLREEYATLDYYELVHFIPASLWREIKGQIGGTEPDFHICVLGGEHATPEELDALQSRIDQLLGQTYRTESENRIREYETNGRQILGMQAIFGGFCVLLAVIGIGDVFTNTVGFVRQRKREFARYMSVGMTPGEIRKMFCVEALVLAGRPALITLPLAVVAVGFMLKMSYLGADEFFAEAPLAPILIFMLAIWSSVALAYRLGWRALRGISLAEVLRDDTML
ncbi:MAG: ABC transporter permease [bacterium]|nr:ABC transporter permease [bacterium]MCM1375817.1 ABC transporter permease [Muribaculum sp.]